MASALRRSSGMIRRWATPAAIATLLVTGGTGVLMFLHLGAGLTKEMHEWAALALVAGRLAHL